MATALEAVRRNDGRSVAVLEKESTIGRHQTGHNSGVIHSGIYYKPGSLKAKNCVAGAAAMVEFCRDHNIAFDVCGKVVVATSESELSGLQELLRRGTANGLANLRRLYVDELREYEPNVAGVAGIHVEETGIVNYRKTNPKMLDYTQHENGPLKYSVLPPVGGTHNPNWQRCLGDVYNAPIAMPRMNDRPTRNRPSTEITTVPPANSTARPLVSIEWTTAVSGSMPSCRASRYRVLMNKA